MAVLCLFKVIQEMQLSNIS